MTDLSARTVEQLQVNDYVRATGTSPDGRTRTIVGYVGDRTGDKITLSAYPDGEGLTTTLTVPPGTAVTITVAPALQDMTLWKHRITGTPATDPSLEALAAGDLIRDRERAHRVRERISEAIAVATTLTDDVSRLALLSPLAQAQLRVTVEDHGPGIIDNADFRPDQLGRINYGPVGRYITEGHLRDLYARYGFRLIWEAVEEYARDAHERAQILTRTPRQVREYAEHRAGMCAERADAAGAALTAADFDTAYDRLDQGQLTDPGYRYGRRQYSWDELRAIVARRELAKEPDTGASEHDHQNHVSRDVAIRPAAEDRPPFGRDDEVPAPGERGATDAPARVRRPETTAATPDDGPPELRGSIVGPVRLVRGTPLTLHRGGSLIDEHGGHADVLAATFAASGEDYTETVIWVRDHDLTVRRLVHPSGDRVSYVAPQDRTDGFTLPDTPDDVMLRAIVEAIRDNDGYLDLVTAGPALHQGWADHDGRITAEGKGAARVAVGVRDTGLNPARKYLDLIDSYDAHRSGQMREPISEPDPEPGTWIRYENLATETTGARGSVTGAAQRTPDGLRRGDVIALPGRPDLDTISGVTATSVTTPPHLLPLGKRLLHLDDGPAIVADHDTDIEVVSRATIDPFLADSRIGTRHTYIPVTGNTATCAECGQADTGTHRHRDTRPHPPAVLTDTDRRRIVVAAEDLAPGLISEMGRHPRTLAHQIIAERLQRLADRYGHDTVADAIVDLICDPQLGQEWPAALRARAEARTTALAAEDLAATTMIEQGDNRGVTVVLGRIEALDPDYLAGGANLADLRAEGASRAGLRTYLQAADRNLPVDQPASAETREPAAPVQAGPGERPTAMPDGDDRPAAPDHDLHPLGSGTQQPLPEAIESKRDDDPATPATLGTELSEAGHDEQPGTETSDTDPPSPYPSEPADQMAPAGPATKDEATPALRADQARPGAAVLPHSVGTTPMDYQVRTAHRVLNAATDTIDLAWAAGAILIHPENLPRLLADPAAVFGIGADLVRADEVVPLHATDGQQRYLHVDTRSRTLAVLTDVTATADGYVPAGPPMLTVPTAELEQLLAAVPEPLAGRVHTAASGLSALEQRHAAATTAARLRDPDGNDAWHRWRPAYQLQRAQIIRELHYAAATVWRTMRPGTHSRAYENQLLQQAVDAVPDNVIDHDEQGNPTVLLARAARDVYGTVTGTDVHGAPLTATGYLTGVLQYQGHTVLTARLANEPTNDPLRADALLRVALDARITVLPRPGERDIDTSRPVLALPEVEQILATRDQLGWAIEVTERVVGARHFPIWTVGDDEPVTPLLDMIRGGYSGSGRSAWRADFAQRWIDQATAVGTYRPVGVLDADGRLMLPPASDAGCPDRPDTTEATLVADERGAPTDDPGELDALFSLPSIDGALADGRTPLDSVHTRVQATRFINEPGEYGPYGEFTGTPCRWDGAPNGSVVVPGSKQQTTARGYLVRLDSWTGGIRVDGSSNTRYGQKPVWLAFVASLPDITPTAPGVQMITVPAGGTFTALPEPAEVQFPAEWPWRWRDRQRRERAHEILAGAPAPLQNVLTNVVAPAAPADAASGDLPDELQRYDAFDRVRILNAVQDHGDSPSPLDHGDAEAIGRFIAGHQLKHISARDGLDTTAATVTAVLNARPDLMDQPEGQRDRVIVERRQRLRDLLAEHRQCAEASDLSGARAALDRMERIDPDAFVAPDVPPREAAHEVRLAGGQRRIGERILAIGQMREALPADPIGGDLRWAAGAILLPKPDHVAAVLGGADPLTADADRGEITISGGEGRRLLADPAAGKARLTDADGNLIAEIPGTAIVALLHTAAAHASGIGSHLDTALRRQKSAIRQAKKAARARSAGQDPVAPTDRAGQLAARAADAAVTKAVAGLWETASGIAPAVANRAATAAAPSSPAALSDNDRAEARRDSIRRVAVNDDAALDELLAKIGDPRMAQAVVEDTARRYALGYPAVGKGRGDYFWSCPILDCDTSRGDLLTTRDVRSMWLSHAARAHPEYTPGWDDTNWPTTTTGPVALTGPADQGDRNGQGGRNDQASMPRVDDPAFGVHTARRRTAYSLKLETGEPSLPDSLVDLTAAQLAALENAGDVHGMVYAVIARRDTGKAIVTGPFINADAAWTWWHVPANKAVRNHDRTVLFTLLSTPEREAHWLYLQAEAHEIIANANRGIPRHLMVWAAGVHEAMEARTIAASWHSSSPGFVDNPNSGGTFRPQADGPNIWLHRDRKGWHLTEDIPGEKVIFGAAWREISDQVHRERLPAEVVEQLESANAAWKATWLPYGDARRNEPEQREREQTADRQSKAAATTAWLSARPQPGGQLHARHPDTPTLFTSEVTNGLTAPARSADQSQHTEHAAGSVELPAAATGQARTASAVKEPRAARRHTPVAEGQQDLFGTLWGAEPEQLSTERTGREPVRATDPEALAETPPEPVRADHRPGDLLRRAGRDRSDADPNADRLTGGRGPAGGELHGQAGPDQHGPDQRGGRGDAGDAAARGGHHDSLTAPAPAVPRFRPAGQHDLAPSGELTRIRANLAALRTLRGVQAAQRPATADEQAVLARWSGWGAIPAALDDTKQHYAWVREELAQLLDEQEMAAARRTVINSHYTDAALVQVIWDAVTELGFADGQVLEPGCGSGNFLAFAPGPARLTGVELDPVTAAIAAALYPNATILNESFASTHVATGGVDLTIGNVPFGGVRLHDKRDNGGNHAIHNHFIIKSLRATRPGGLVAVITSAYTLDAVNPAARREMQAMGDLVGAVRLPSRAHAKAAGTDALTDVLIFRRRGEHEPAADFGWEYTGQAEVDGIALPINTYFLEHPQRVLGQLAARDGLYRSEELSVAGDPAAAPAQLRERLAEIIQQAQAAGLTMTPHHGPVAAPPAAALPRTARRPDGFLRANDDGTFSRLDDGTWEPYQVPKTQAPELRDLLRLRDTALALLEAEAASVDDNAAIDQLRAELNQRYDAYAGQHGAINRYTDVQARRKDKTTGKMVPAVDEETGEPILRRTRPPAVSRFRSDPFAPVVAALELFNDETQTATKVDIFTQRVVAPRPARLGADTPDEALAICLDEHGEVRLDVVGWLLGLDEQAARVALGTLVFADPATGRLETAAAYLSGDVKTKLALARAAAVEDTAYAANVTALTEVVPRDLNPDEITIKMDAPWIGADYIQQFLTEILDDNTVTVEHGGGVLWSVSARNNTVAATSTWGTDRRSAAEIAQTILEQREFVIKDTVERNGEKRQVVNLDAIMEATEKAVEMKERFSDWVWEDAERAATLVAKYNHLFRRYVPRDYSGTTLSLPGLAMAFKPDPHQVAAVARIIHEPAVGLYHSVGAGKTADMIIGAMELRRLGLATKPVIIVPNQLIDQWLREFLRLYPQARILATASEDLTGTSAAKTAEIRRQTVARMATGDWDAVLLTESAFEMLPMSPAAEEAYLKGEAADLAARIEEAEAAGAETVLKRLETKKANREERLKDRLDNTKDAGIWWELTGIDYLFRDESHRDKNLRTVSNVPGMSIKGSQRATQMDMKLAWLRERQPRWGTRATGTPIANSIIELYTEFKYLRPDLMQELGVIDIDSFLATFADGETVIEVTPDGGGLRNKVRHKFFNLDDLITSTRVFADVKTKDQLDLDRPPLAERADGQRAPETVIVPPSTELLGKVAELVDRAGKLKGRGRRPGKGEDNILKIVGEGAAAALDLELVGLHTDEPQKLDVAADHIAQIYHDNATRIYTGANGEPHPTPGALQMVFCDLGTPSGKPGKFNAYAKLRRLLAAQGVPADKIRFIHEATNDRERAELFAACRDGRVAVIVGSTEKMGTGVNVQDRLLAKHDLDCPWRPCDLEQRDGRIDRRGNQNPEIRILRYSVERSLDAFRWQKVAHKARLADQVLLGQAGRESDDIGDSTLSYEEMKAATTGNPLLIEHAEAKTHLNRLERLERGYHRNRAQLTWTVRNSNEEIAINRALIADVAAAITRRQATRGDAFVMTVDGETYTKRREANEQLHHVLANELRKDAKTAGWTDVGSFAGFLMLVKKVSVYVRIEGRLGTREAVAVALADAPEVELEIFANEVGRADVSTRLENKLAGLEAVRDQAVTDIADREAQIARAEHDLTKPFRHAGALSEGRHLFNRLDAEVKALAAAGDQETGKGEPDDTTATPTPGAAGPELARAKAGPASSTPAAAGVPSRGQADTQPIPAANDATRPATTEPDPLPTLGPILGRLPEDQVQWLIRQLAELAGDEHVRAVAKANSYERARTVLDEQLDEVVAGVTEDPSIADPTALLTAYFDQESVRATFLDTAGRQLYDRARTAGTATPNDEPETPVEALSAPADPGPATTPPAAIRLAQLLTERGITGQPRRWLMGKIGELAEEQLTAQRVHANAEEDAYYGFRGPIGEIFFASVEEREDDGYDLYGRLTGGPGEPRGEEFIRAVIAYLYEVVAEPGDPAADGPDTAVPPPPATEAAAAPAQPSAEKTGPGTQFEGLPETQRRRRGHDFYPPADILQRIPPLYATDGIPKAEKTIYVHYFGGSRDYWIAEYDPATGEAFGYGGTHNALDGLEWGYSHLPELEKLNAGLTIIERDLDWKPIRAVDANLPGGWGYRYVPAARDEATTSSKQSPTQAIEPAAATDAGAAITGQEPAVTAPQVSAVLARAQQFGRDAYAQDRPLAPASDPSIMALMAGRPVGAGGAEVFKAFIDGYTAAGDQAAAAVLEAPEPVRAAVSPTSDDEVLSDGRHIRSAAVDRPVAQVSAATEEPDRTRPPDLRASDVAGLGGGQPYTSTKRIRGPLRDLKTTCNALLRTPGATSKVGRPLVDTINAVRQVTVDNTDPTDLLLWTGALAVRARAALTNLNRNGDGGTFNMLSGVVRSADMLAADLIATVREPGRWQRLFDQAAPDLAGAGATVQSPATQHVPPETPPTSGAGLPPPDANPARPATELGQDKADLARAEAASAAETVQASLFDPPAAAGQAPDPAQTPADLPDGTPPSATAAAEAEPSPTEDGELSDLQRQLLTELAKERGEAWSVGRQWRLKTFQEATANDVDGLPPAESEALRADLHAGLDSPDFRERAIARTTLRAWSGTAPPLTQAQQLALHALTHYDVPGAAAVDRYGQLTAVEYLALGDDDRADITADLKTIAASGATKTIPSNRTAYGTTIRGVDADHVSAARYLLGSIGRGVKPHRFHQHADKVGRTVVAIHLNPGDQIMVRGTVMTVDRIGIDDNIRLTGGKGATLKNLTSRYRLVTAAPEPGTASTSPPDAPTNTDVAASTSAPETPAPEDDAASGQDALFQDPAALGAQPDTTTPQPAAEPEPLSAASTPSTAHGPSSSAETGEQHPQAAEPAANQPASIGAPSRPGRAGGPEAPKQGPAQSAGADGGGPADSGPVAEHVRDPDQALAPDAPPERSMGAPADESDSAPLSDTVPAVPGDPDPSTEATSMPNTSDPGAHVLGHIKVINDGGFARVTGTTGHPDEAPLRDFLKDASNFADGLRFSLRRDRGEWILRGSPDQAGRAASAVRQWLQNPLEAVQPTTATSQAPSRPEPKPAATARKKASQITLSSQQQAILQAYLDGQNIAVQALAGTGKTSTLVALAEATPGKKIAYFAFNRSIADEAKGKFDPKVVHAATSHSFAKTGLRKHRIAPKLDRIVAGDGWPRDWTARLQITDLIPRRGEQAEAVDKDRIAGAVMSTVNAFRLSADTELDTRHLPDHVAQGDRRRRDVVLGHARRAWADKISLDGVLPFSHDDYRKIWALTNPILTHEVIFFDEAQDMPPVMEKVIKDQQAAGKQVVIVGDSQQSIYGFTGASDAIGRWPADVVLPLTQSWRFGAAVADVGNRLLLSLNSPWQLQGNPNLNSAIGHVPLPDAVLARTNSGAVAAVFDAFDQGRKVALVGGSKVIEDIAKAALALQAGRRTSHPDLSGFTSWTDVVKAVGNDENGAQSLRAFVRLVESRGAQELLEMARTLVPEKATTEDGKPAYDVIVCTAHRAKGLEWEFVRIASDFPQPEENLETGEIRLPDPEERRLAYVALTRGRTRTELGSLDYVMSPALNQQRTIPTKAASSRRAAPTDVENTTGVVAATDPADTPSPAAVASDADRTPRSVAVPPGPVAVQPAPAIPAPRPFADRIQQEASADPGAGAEPRPAVSPTTPERDHLGEQNRSAAEDAMPHEAPAVVQASPRPSRTFPKAAHPPRRPAKEANPAVTAPASTSTTVRADPETPEWKPDVLDTLRLVSATPAPQRADRTTVNSAAPATELRPPLAAAAELVTAAQQTSAPSAASEPGIEETVSTEPQDITTAEPLPAQDATAERHTPPTTATSGTARTANADVEASPDEETGQQTSDTPSIWQQARLTLADHTNAPENHLAWALAATAIRAGTADGNWSIASNHSTAPVIDGVIEGQINEHLRFRADKSGARLEHAHAGTVLYAADWNRLLRILAPAQATALATVTKAAADARRRVIEFATVPWERMTQLQQKLTTRWKAARDKALTTIGRIWSSVRAALPTRQPATVHEQADHFAQTDLLRGKAEPDRVPPTESHRESHTAPERPGPHHGDVPTAHINDAGATSAATNSPDDRASLSPMQPTDLAHIRLVVMDTAAEYFDSSQAYGIAGTAVHLAQHHLQDETIRYGLIPVVQAAADVMHQDESALTRSAEQRQTARHDRNAQSEMFANLIRSVAAAGHDETALRLIAEAELLNPRHRTTWAHEPDLGWDQLSERIRSWAHPAAQAFTPMPCGTPTTADRPKQPGPGQAFTAAGNPGAPTSGNRPATPPQPTPAGSRHHR